MSLKLRKLHKLRDRNKNISYRELEEDVELDKDDLVAEKGWENKIMKDIPKRFLNLNQYLYVMIIEARHSEGISFGLKIGESRKSLVDKIRQLNNEYNSHENIQVICIIDSYGRVEEQFIHKLLTKYRHNVIIKQRKKVEFYYVKDRILRFFRCISEIDKNVYIKN